jgi:hypothetical protein
VLTRLEVRKSSCAKKYEKYVMNVDVKFFGQNSILVLFVLLSKEMLVNVSLNFCINYVIFERQTFVE